MDGTTVSVAAQAALETLPRDADGNFLDAAGDPFDNGSCYISREFGGVLDEHDLAIGGSSRTARRRMA